MKLSVALLSASCWLLACGPKAAPEAPAASAPEPAPVTPAATPEPAEPATPVPTAAKPVAPPTRTPATSFALSGNDLTLPSPITFDTGSADLTASSEPALWHIVDYLQAKTYISTLRVEGHVVGSNAQALSEARAAAVTKWLAAHNIACERLVAVGFGDNKPVADGSSPEGRAANTRITVANAALRGRAIGSMPLDGGGKQVPACP